MYNTKRIAWRAYKKGYHTGESIKWFSYFHSILTGACFTFFIGLFSVPPVNISNSFPLWWATLGFAISTLLNTGFSLFYIFASGEREFIFELHSYSKVGNLLIITSLALPVISFIMLLFYYSTHIGVIILFVTAIILLIIKRMFSEIKSTKDKIEKKKLWSIENEKFDDYDTICEHYDFPIFTPEEQTQRNIEFYFLIKINKIIKNFQDSNPQIDNMDNIDFFNNELLSIIHEMYNSRNFHPGILSKKTKELILLTMTDNNELNKEKIAEELTKLNEYIENRLYNLK
ncbi:hypothetical protein FFT88_03600 [Escherichia sp. E4930]|uniref:hypothetical protein n=1 Tax=Escherichia sp. E4930 TaxID=2044468 RepID=UPI00107F306F|nr:hypothetical protein [Escherichia sp. E4930]TGB68989.1 hypothetical protein CRG96_08905 [Escherichia sp. E4930]TLU80217.1 hypothetical protein FFT88_03600 [Escherichia sp. E4930]